MPATIHPAFLAIVAVVGIGLAIYSIFSEERPHLDSYRDDRLRPCELPEEYDTHPNRRRRRVSTQTNCVICLDPLSEPNIRLNCSHVFHTSCMNRWLQQKQECPTCRRPVLRHVM